MSGKAKQATKVEESSAQEFRLLDRYCPCETQLSTWSVRCCNAVGRKLEECHICLDCLAEEYDMTLEEFEEYLSNYFGLLPCRGYA